MDFGWIWRLFSGDFEGTSLPASSYGIERAAQTPRQPSTTPPPAAVVIPPGVPAASSNPPATEPSVPVQSAPAIVAQDAPILASEPSAADRAAWLAELDKDYAASQIRPVGEGRGRGGRAPRGHLGRTDPLDDWGSGSGSGSGPGGGRWR